MRCLLLTLVSAFGCSTSLTSLQPARTMPEGHFGVTASVQGTPAVGLPGESYQTLEDLDIGSRPTPAELEQIGELSTAALVQPPSVDGQLALAYGVTRRFELDARVGASSAGAGFRIQLMRRSPGIYASLGASLSLGYDNFPVERFTNRVRVESFRRQDFAFPLMLGYSGTYVHLWAGPKLVISRFRSGIAVCTNRSGGECHQEAMLDVGGHATYFAGQIGFAVGKGRIWIATELTIAHVRVNADLDLQMGETRQLSEYRTSGRVVTPAIGLIAWF